MQGTVVAESVGRRGVAVGAAAAGIVVGIVGITVGVAVLGGVGWATEWYVAVVRRGAPGGSSSGSSGGGGGELTGGTRSGCSAVRRW